MEFGKPVKWRAHFNQLIARPIPESEFPKIASRMYDDGLVAMLTSEGIIWYAGRYRVPQASVRDAWSLSVSQMKRFQRWVYSNDPFMVMMESETDE
tara:strand:- start:924 stop:1211 length:288 start_codon:yes stop_codon:yes gene_type:complete